MAKLTLKQKAFAAEYLVDLNAAAAATRAGYSERTARAKGYVLLQNPDIQAEIREGMAQRAKRLEISQDMVIQELARIAFSTPHGRRVWSITSTARRSSLRTRRN